MSTRFEYRSISLFGCLAMAGFGLSGCSDTTAPPVLTVSAVATSEGQSAPAGNSLPSPLRVRVESDGTPKAGVMVTWQASAGTISPASSLTDANGEASATWILGTVAGPMTVSTTIAGAQGSPVTFHATALGPSVRVTVVAASNGQTGTVGTTLPQPLQVKVDTNGTPKAGVLIHWRSPSGSVAPEGSMSDSNGIASATWTLGSVSGSTAAYATMAGTTLSQMFSATALPGPAAAIGIATGAGQTSPANRGPFDSLVAVVSDLYSNRVQGQAVTWTIERGPVAFVTMGGTTNATGLSTTIVKPTGTAGNAIVRAAVPGIATSADFALTISPPASDVVLHTFPDYKFVSSQNGSTDPAVDTIPVGATMTWTLEFDYDNHGVRSVGSPSFTGGDFPYANPSTVSVTFTTPGRYSYNDPYHPTATGVVLVR
jgi:plastocyanin